MFGSHMNPQRARHMGIAESHENGGKNDKPDVFIHSHANGHTVHVFHKDGAHEKHEFGHGDARSVADKVHESLGGNNEAEMHEDGEGLGAATD